MASTRCTVRYQPPDDDGDAPVTGYHLQRRRGDGDGGRWETVKDEPIAATELVVDHLEQLSRYEFRVAAENRLGTGDFSPASRLISTDNSVRTYVSTSTSQK